MHYDFKLFLCHVFKAIFLSERTKALVKRSHLGLESSMTVFLCLCFMVTASANILMLTVDKYNEDVMFADGLISGATCI